MPQQDTIESTRSGSSIHSLGKGAPDRNRSSSKEADLWLHDYISSCVGMGGCRIALFCVTEGACEIIDAMDSETVSYNLTGREAASNNQSSADGLEAQDRKGMI